MSGGRNSHYGGRWTMGGRLLRESEAGSSVSGFDTRFITTEDICERSSSEGMLCSMEFGQEESESEDTNQAHIFSRLFRDVLIGELFSLGLGNSHESNSVIRWMNSDRFDACCNLACWNEYWVMDLFKSISILPDVVRKPVAKKCLRMLKAIAKLDVDESDISISDHITSTDAKDCAYPMSESAYEVIVWSTGKFDALKNKEALPSHSKYHSDTPYR